MVKNWNGDQSQNLTFPYSLKPEILTLIKKESPCYASVTHVDECVTHALLTGALSLTEKQIDSF